MGVHQFLIGKESRDDLWFQVNGEYRDRPGVILFRNKYFKKT